MKHPDDTSTIDLFGDEPLPSVSPDRGPPPRPPESSAQDHQEGVPLGAYAERCYLAYAMSVVKGRALPDVEDGMKPVQRRILYAMREMGLGSSTKHVKSARVVGDVIGKLHPHGDQSVYDAMVRMAQSFTLRYPLIDGQGNFGSRDGDSPAAMRYTESRLTPIAELLLSEIDLGTVDFKPNYDGAFQEPDLLPARLPMLLANGASGIAVGMATEIPPHNLGELAAGAVAILRNPEISLDEVMTHLPGPDYPGGGQVITHPNDIRTIYESGRGSLRVRARWTMEPLTRGQWRIVVNELPPGISSAQVLTEIEALTNPQPRAGKKELHQDQKNLKTAMLAALETVRDESDEKCPVRLVLEPHSRNQDAEEFMRLMLAHTSLETTAPVNLTVVGRDGRPGQRGLLALLAEWAAFRVDTVRRRSRHRLDAVLRRLHILQGRQAVLLNLDEVIRVIREADEPKPALMARFDLTEIQAEDILEIRLRQLARLEAIKIEKEMAELVTERDGLRRILEDADALQENVIGEIMADARRFGDPRRTRIEQAQAITASVVEAAVPDEPATVIVSRNGWLRARTGHGIDRTGLAFKSGDAEFAVLETRTTWPLVVLDTTGRTYTIKVSDLPTGRGDGIPLTSQIDMPPKARMVAALSGSPDTRLMVATRSGYGFLCQLSDLLSRNRAGKAFMTVGEDDVPLAPAVAMGDWVAASADNGKLLVFPVQEMKTLSGGKGVQIMKIEDGEAMTTFTLFAGDRLVVEGKNRTGRTIKVTLTGVHLDRHRLHRARRGSLVDKIAVVERVEGQT